MRPRSAPVISAVVIALVLAGCATASPPTGTTAPQAASDTARETPEPTATSEPTPPSEIADAREQAQAWLDAAVLPPGAVSTDASVAEFHSFTGWPCGPVEELEGFWAIPDASLADTANWLIDNPPADLVATAVGRVSDAVEADSTAVGFTPADRSHQGIVYTVETVRGGVAVRAEVAALTESATCPTPPGGGEWGLPGQG